MRTAFSSGNHLTRAFKFSKTPLTGTIVLPSIIIGFTSSNFIKNPFMVTLMSSFPCTFTALNVKRNTTITATVANFFINKIPPVFNFS